MDNIFNKMIEKIDIITTYEELLNILSTLDKNLH